MFNDMVFKKIKNKRIADVSDSFNEGFKDVVGYDSRFRRHRLRGGKMFGKVNALIAEFIISLDEDSDVMLIWSIDGKEFYRSKDLSRIDGGRFGGGLISNEGCLRQGNYRCDLIKNQQEIDSIFFKIDRLGL